MAVQINNQYAGVAAGDLLAGRNVRSNTHQTMQHDRHHFHARSGARIVSDIYVTPWTTSSATLTQTGTDGRSLGATAKPFRLYRAYGNDVAQNVGLTLRVHGHSFDVQASIITADTQATLLTFNLSRVSGTSDWETESLELTEANAKEGGILVNDPRLFVCRIFANKNAGSAGDATITQIVLNEKIIEVADL